MGENMEYKRRLIKENNDLNEKIKKLESFLNYRKIEISEEQEELMKKQLIVMKEYLEILEQRILLEMGGIKDERL